MLSGLGLAFRLADPSVDEEPEEGESPATMVTRLARAKARSGAGMAGGRIVIGADSTVVLGGRVLGKPGTPEEARGMLVALRGRVHHVITGVAVEDSATGRTLSGSIESTVRMREYSDLEIDAYVESGEPMDKAGAYAIQDPRFRPAEGWDGCYTNIMGLPICFLADLLREVGVETPLARVPSECQPCPLRNGIGEGI